VTYASNLV